MSRRVFLWLFWPLLAAWAIWLLFATHVLAQELVAPQYVYTSADPVRPGAIGLATLNGRFAVSMADTCAAANIGPGMNVVLWQVDGFSGIGVIGLFDENGPITTRMCGVRFEQQTDPTPCFTNADGVCDVTLEQPED